MQKRSVRVLTTDGLVTLSLGRPDRSLVGTHWNAIRRFIEYGDDTLLDLMKGTTVGLLTSEVELETDLDEIEYHATIGEMTFEDIYAAVV